MYSKLTIENESAIKRFSHVRRFNTALDILELKNSKSFLDYGTGDGYFLICLHKKYPQARIVGYEPVPDMFDQLASTLNKDEENTEILITQDLEALDEKSFDTITCLEVLEHFNEPMQRTMLGHFKRLLKQNGMIVISVPIEVGVSSLIKNLLRFSLQQTHQDVSLHKVIMSVLGIPIERKTGSYIFSHIGFYYFDLEKVILEEGLSIDQKIFSPFRMLGNFINSQVFYVVSIP